MAAASLKAHELLSASTELRDKLEARSAWTHGFCAGTFVAPGVTVDDGAIVRAGVIVLKDVKPWMIVLENTARD